MERELIVITGNQGMGKSVWAKAWAASKQRLFVFDPKASYAADFVTDPEKYIERIIRGDLNTFRVGTYLESELEMYGNAAFAAGFCSYVIEECALIFERGEKLREWARPLVFMGREKRIDLVLIAQRASKIPIDLRSQATRFISFRQSEPDDVKYLINRYGDAAEEIDTFPPLQCLDWNDGVLRSYSVRP